jgi:hypothetical protein
MRAQTAQDLAEDERAQFLELVAVLVDAQAEERLDRTAPLPTRGRKYVPLSRRGLLNPLIIDPACPWCGQPHVYRSAGLRIAACRGGYVEIKARKVGRPTSRNCQQATVSTETVSTADSFAARLSEPLACGSGLNPAASAPGEIVSADNCSAPSKDRSQ